jgi:hypothetical protein
MMQPAPDASRLQVDEIQLGLTWICSLDVVPRYMMPRSCDLYPESLDHPGLFAASLACSEAAIALV